jgi:hypothetical protein
MFIGMMRRETKFFMKLNKKYADQHVKKVYYQCTIVNMYCYNKIIFYWNCIKCIVKQISQVYCGYL